MLSLEDQEENFLFQYETMQKATECIMVLVIVFWCALAVVTSSNLE